MIKQVACDAWVDGDPVPVTQVHRVDPFGERSRPGGRSCLSPLLCPVRGLRAPSGWGCHEGATSPEAGRALEELLEALSHWAASTR